MFNFNWSLFNTRLGLIFTVGCLIVFSLPPQEHFSPIAGGISALLAWFTVILVPNEPRQRHLAGLVAYALVGCALTWMAAWLAPDTPALLISMGAVTFVGYMFLLRGMHSFLISWCLVYWYLLVPLFFGEGGMWPVLTGHLMGAGLVFLLNLAKPVWSLATRHRRGETGSETVADEPPATATASAADEDTAGTPAEESITVGFAASFAAVVSVCIVTGLGFGVRLFASDPTIIANATLNMISPSLKQTWHSAVERLVLGTAGLVGGFYFGWYFPEPWVGVVVMMICSFLTLALVYVNFGLLVCALFFLIAYQWGILQTEAAHQIGNEKLTGEFVGVFMAVIAISILTRLKRPAALAG